AGGTAAGPGTPSDPAQMATDVNPGICTISSITKLISNRRSSSSNHIGGQSHAGIRFSWGCRGRERAWLMEQKVGCGRNQLVGKSHQRMGLKGQCPTAGQPAVGLSDFDGLEWVRDG